MFTNLNFATAALVADIQHPPQLEAVPGAGKVGLGHPHAVTDRLLDRCEDDARDLVDVQAQCQAHHILFPLGRDDIHLRLGPVEELDNLWELGAP